MKNHRWILTFAAAGLLLAAQAQGAPVCFPYTDGGRLQVGLEPAPAAMQQQVQATLEQFLAVAKQGKQSTIVTQFSAADNSQESVANELAGMPDKFSGYAGIQSAAVGDSFRWGNYVVSWVEYQHQRGQARLLESFYCAGQDCAVSNRFERSSESVDLTSRWLSYARLGAPVACPGGKAAFEIRPEQARDASNPLYVYLDAPYVGKVLNRQDSKALPKGYQATVGQCMQRAMSADFAQMDEASLAEFLRGLISVCATNMDERSLIPVVKMGAQTERSYLSPLSFAQLLGRLQQAVLLYVIHDGEHQVNLFSAKTGEDETLLLALPLTQPEGRFDWEYFGTGAGELLTSSSFGGFVKARHPEAFK